MIDPKSKKWDEYWETKTYQDFIYYLERYKPKYPKLPKCFREEIGNTLWHGTTKKALKYIKEDEFIEEPVYLTNSENATRYAVLRSWEEEYKTKAVKIKIDISEYDLYVDTDPINEYRQELFEEIIEYDPKEEFEEWKIQDMLEFFETSSF